MEITLQSENSKYWKRHMEMVHKSFGEVKIFAHDQMLFCEGKCKGENVLKSTVSVDH
jgi:hypothetical protein